MNGGGVKPTGWLDVLQLSPMSMSFYAAASQLYGNPSNSSSPSSYSSVLDSAALYRSASGTRPNLMLFSDSTAALLEQATLSPAHEPNWRHPALAVVLALLCVTTVAGNCLVVLAVCTKKYLRNPTGYLIVSLAFADLIVGLVVMPLNSLFEMTRHVWLLGLTMCDLFHALDILASTSSIWNLCVISLDRYMAGQDPIGYRDKVSTRRITIAIIFVWVISACLSFPAIIWWRRSSPHLYEDQTQCHFTDSWVYVIFSSLVSFYIPLILILFAYGRVFLIATRHSRSLKSGIKKVKCKKSKKVPGSETVGSDDNMPTLRIHFGRGKPQSHNPTSNPASASVGTPIVSALTSMAVTNGNTRLHNNTRQSPTQGNFHRDYVSAATSTTTASGPPDTKAWLRQASSKSLLTNASDIQCLPHGSSNSPLLRPDPGSVNTWGIPRGRSCTSVPKNGAATVFVPPLDRTASMIAVMPTEEASEVSSCIVATDMGAARKRMGVREKSRQMMRYVHEQRAARTLSIVVGAFILCWMPFFIFSPLIALCSTCVSNQEQVFSIITWAGHLNSMLNPLIYSRFSRDFRRAFKQILTCQRERPMKKAIKTPLNIVFAQLVSITQFWEQPPGECQGESPRQSSLAE